MSGWLLLAAGGAAALWYLLPHALRRLAERRLAARCRAARAIVLSYDDGPSDALTPALLDLLRREEAVASFFVLGCHAERRPELVARALAEGHEIGSHSHDHAHAWKASPLRWARDLVRGVASVDRLGGDGRLVRPPYGKRTLAALALGARHRLRWAWWTIDSGDSLCRRPVAAVLAELERQGGGVLLMHDFAGEEGHPAGCLALTEAVIAFARARGLRLMRLGELQASARWAAPATSPSTVRSVSS